MWVTYLVIWFVKWAMAKYKGGDASKKLEPMPTKSESVVCENGVCKFVSPKERKQQQAKEAASASASVAASGDAGDAKKRD
jgi:hypothetical protein